MASRYCTYCDWDKNIGLTGGWRCRITGERILSGSDIYNNYCHNYEWNYTKCPFLGGMRSSSSSSSSNTGCYLTSACTEARSLADDCHELTVLRAFRDGYLKAQPNGQAEIDEYYRAAPVIVDAIHAHPDCSKILDSLYEELVAPCVKMIEEADYEGAHALYREKVLELTKIYLKGSNE